MTVVRLSRWNSWSPSRTFTSNLSENTNLLENSKSFETPIILFQRSPDHDEQETSGRFWIWIWSLTWILIHFVFSTHETKWRRRGEETLWRKSYVFFLCQKEIKYIFLFFRYIECTLFLVLQRNNWYSSFFKILIN